MMMRLTSIALASGVALLAPALQPAWAADTGDDTSSSALAEVTVTATRQTENLQKVEAAVTAVSADALFSHGVGNLREAQKLVPSVRFQAEQDNTQVVIRGIGSTLDEANVEPLVAFNLAGIYVPREATSAAFFDLEQLEVLPGPQGTLYGRSAAGGTINITPFRPDFNYEGSTALEVGNYGTVHATVAQNLKASDTVAFRANRQMICAGTGSASSCTMSQWPRSMNASMCWLTSARTKASMAGAVLCVIASLKMARQAV